MIRLHAPITTNICFSIGFYCMIATNSFARTESSATADQTTTDQTTTAAAVPASEAALNPSGGYVHQWIAPPSVKLKNLSNGSIQSLGVAKGQIGVLVFIASYCEPCQQIIKQLQAIEKVYKGLDVRFSYIFSHDTEQDASSFSKEYKLTHAYLANHEVLKEYHNPELPSIYLIDKKGWLATRYIQVTKENLSEDLPSLLSYLTAF